jgi:hypothetical protein
VLLLRPTRDRARASKLGRYLGPNPRASQSHKATIGSSEVATEDGSGSLSSGRLTRQVRTECRTSFQFGRSKELWSKSVGKVGSTDEDDPVTRHDLAGDRGRLPTPPRSSSSGAMELNRVVVRLALPYTPVTAQVLRYIVNDVGTPDLAHYLHGLRHRCGLSVKRTTRGPKPLVCADLGNSAPLWQVRRAKLPRVP